MYYEYLQEASLRHGMAKKAEVDSLKGNFVSAMVPMGTANKVNKRTEGVAGYLLRNLAQAGGSTVSMSAASLLADILARKRLPFWSTKSLAAMAAAYVPGRVAGDRVMDYVL